MENPWTLKSKSVLSKPELDWEIKLYWVNEGPAILKKNGKIFLTYFLLVLQMKIIALECLQLMKIVICLIESPWEKSRNQSLKHHMKIQMDQDIIALQFQKMELKIF